MEIFIAKNFQYMIDSLGKSCKEIVSEESNKGSTKEKLNVSLKTIRRLMRNNQTSPSTLNEIVNYYNENGSKLYPHNITVEEFKMKDLSQYLLQNTKPQWDNKQVEGIYICPYLSRRGTGKTKVMVLRIKEENHTLKAYAITTVQSLDRLEYFVTRIFKQPTLEASRQAYNEIKNCSSLRSCRFLDGEVSGCGNLISMDLTDEHETYQLIISTSLSTYLSACNNATTAYKVRGGAAITFVRNKEDWPYSMVIGMVRHDHWKSEVMTSDFFAKILERMHSFQKKHNMLCLQQDIDELWYECFMEVNRQQDADIKCDKNRRENER